jgi:DNA-directed RNA polymerase subunit N (RpoN/RPB10)
MLMPVRCFSCGFPVAEYYDKYNDLVKKGKSQKEALDELKIEKYCCRRMLLSNVDYIHELLKYQK